MGLSQNSLPSLAVVEVCSEEPNSKHSADGDEAEGEDDRLGEAFDEDVANGRMKEVRADVALGGVDLGEDVSQVPSPPTN